MIKIKGNAQLEALYPDEFVTQCVALKNRCNKCGEGFGAGLILKCPHCGEPRKRCQNHHMTNEDVCRIHAHGRPYNLYTRLAANLSDVALEEFIERGDMDLSQEFALARLALSGILEKQVVTSEELLAHVNTFMSIAQKKKKVEEGDTLNIQWNDELVNSLRKRWRQVIGTLGCILEEELKPHLKEGVTSDFVTKIVLARLQEETKLLGNHITVPDAKKDNDTKI